MVDIYCDCNEDNTLMEFLEKDDRQEWCTETYCCPKCNKTIIRKIWYDQNGFITNDEIL